MCEHEDVFKPQWREWSGTQDSIDALFRLNDVQSFDEFYYDSEPDVDEDAAEAIYGKDYWDDPDWNKKWKSMCAEYEPQRLVFNNWVEPHFAGNWEVTQDEVNEVGRVILEECINNPDRAERLYSTHTIQDDKFVLYWYGRDLQYKCDYYWVFKEKENGSTEVLE